MLERDCAPINPFLNFDYNLSNSVQKSAIRIANNTMMKRVDELWVFGEVSDGVLMEVHLAQKEKKPVRFFLPTHDETSFREISIDHVPLEDVSSWMWECVLRGQDLARWHPRLRFTKTYPLVYPAYSKHLFFLQSHISKFVLERRRVPLNPFMLFRYFLGDTVERSKVYQGNNTFVQMCDEVWVFGKVSNGVLAEIVLKKSQGCPITYFEPVLGNIIQFRRVDASKVAFETSDLEAYRHEL